MSGHRFGTPSRRSFGRHVAEAMVLGTSAGLLWGAGYTAVWTFVSHASTSWSLTLGEYAQMVGAGTLIGGPSGCFGGLMIGFLTSRWRGDVVTTGRRAVVAAMAGLLTTPLLLTLVVSLGPSDNLSNFLRVLALVLVGPALAAAMAGWLLVPLLLRAEHPRSGHTGASVTMIAT